MHVGPIADRKQNDIAFVTLDILEILDEDSLLGFL